MIRRNETAMVASPTLHASIMFTMAAFLAIIVMSFIFKVEVVARGTGRVVPVGRVQVVQPEFPGRINAIHAKNGLAVKQGDVLIELDPTEATAEYVTIKSEQERLEIEAARIGALVETLALDVRGPEMAAKALSLFALPTKLNNQPFATGQRALLAAEIDNLLASLAQIAAREEANSRSKDVTGANIARIEAAIKIQAERLATAEQLLSRGTTSRATFLDVQQTYTALERERDVFLRELDLKSAEGGAFSVERRSTIANLLSTLLDRQTQIGSRLSTLADDEPAARRRLDATVLKAPMSGIVDQLSVFTIGGIAETGAELLRIVPTDVQIEIEGTFSNQDVGFLEVGQTANVGLDAYPAERFGFVQGEVTDIAADSTKITDGQWGYVLRISPNNASLKAGGKLFPLRPGMTASIDVVTDNRSLISYFFAPIIQTMQEALGER